MREYDRCGKCGWKRPPAPVVSTATRVPSNTWKAQQDARKWLAERGMGSATVDELRAEAGRLAAARENYPGKGWARSLKSRILDGENVCVRARDMVEEVLGDKDWTSSE